jgi:hypothetical protein
VPGEGTSQRAASECSPLFYFDYVFVFAPPSIAPAAQLAFILAAWNAPAADKKRHFKQNGIADDYDFQPKLLRH